MKLAIRDDMTVDSRTIAEGCGVTHKAALQLLASHKAEIENELGRVAFQMAPLATRGGAQEQRVAFLTENQATALITMFRNTKVVVRFKVALSKAYGEAKNRLNQKPRPKFKNHAQAAEYYRLLADQSEAMSLMEPRSTFGEISRHNGLPKLALRRAAYVAAKSAAESYDRAGRLHELNAQMLLGLEESQ